MESGKLSPLLGHVLSDAVLSLVASLMTENISLLSAKGKNWTWLFFGINLCLRHKAGGCSVCRRGFELCVAWLLLSLLLLQEGGCSPPKTAGRARALCGDGDSHWSAAGNGEDVMLARASHCQGVVNSE